MVIFIKSNAENSKIGPGADWPLYYMPQPLLDFESDLNYKDCLFITAIKNFDSAWESMSFGSCESTDCCEKSNNSDFQ